MNAYLHTYVLDLVNLCCHPKVIDVFFSHFMSVYPFKLSFIVRDLSINYKCSFIMNIYHIYLFKRNGHYYITEVILMHLSYGHRDKIG